MSSLLSPMHTFRSSTSRLCKRDQLLSLLHTSSSLSKQHAPRKRPKIESTTAPSRTRLAKNLKPGSSSGSVEVAPRQRRTGPEPEPSFSRDSVPHADVSPKQERNPSFRRRSERRNEQDWSRRIGRWGLDGKEYEADERRRTDVRRRSLSKSPGFGVRRDEDMRDRLSERRTSYFDRPSRRPQRSETAEYRAEDSERQRNRSEESDYRSNRPKRSSIRTERMKPRYALGRPESRVDGSETRPLTSEDRSRWSRRSNGSSAKPQIQPQRSASPRSSLQTYRQPSGSNHPSEISSNTSRQSGIWSQQTDNRSQPVYDSEKPPDSSERNRHPLETSSKHHPSVITEFYHPPPTPVGSIPSEQTQLSLERTENQLPTKFTSPPLMPGLLSCLTDVLGLEATPTPIQSLSLKWLFERDADAVKKTGVIEHNKNESGWNQFLLASETGSGKSIAYLLPVLQALKQSELRTSSTALPPHGHPRRPLNPRALILAPTHELARQLSGFAKALLHEIKLRVLCASRANVKNSKEKEGTASKMAEEFEAEVRVGTGDVGGEFQLHNGGRSFPVDLVVGTPMKLLEMVRGRGWDRKESDEQEQANSEESNAVEQKRKARRGRDMVEGFGKWRSKPEMGLENVEWVVVDEADVLFDPDFQETTRMLLADISAARGQPATFSPQSPLPSKDLATPVTSSPPSSTDKMPVDYPFNFILTSATIPSALAAYLDKHHPKLIRLASPNLHHLPKTLQTEYVNWTGGNKNADIERRIRRVWAEDSAFGGVAVGRFANGEDSPDHSPLSKVLVFCNRSTKVNELGEYLADKGIKNIALTSTSDQRKRGSNHHLDGFLRKNAKGNDEDKTSTTPGPDSTSITRLIQRSSIKQDAAGSTTPRWRSNPKEDPHVMITTSLLSRGLDFSPAIRHVFIVDEPRNMIDFLHRAGRSGRAGERGKVVVFGKMKGRGSTKAKDVRRRVGALVA